MKEDIQLPGDSHPQIPAYLQSKDNVDGGSPGGKADPRPVYKQEVQGSKDEEDGHDPCMKQCGDERAPLHLTRPKHVSP